MNSEQQDINRLAKANFEQFLRVWWQSLLFGTKLVIGISWLFGFIDLLSDYAFDLFSNSPEQTIPFQIQRLFFSQFVHYYTIDLMLAIICVYKKLEELEQKHSSALFIILIVVLGCLTQFICVLLQWILSFIYSPFYSIKAYGLWNYYIFCVIQECLTAPNGQSLFLIFPMQLKNQYYPIVLVIFFTLIQQSLTFISTGFLGILFFLFQNHFTQINHSTIERFEKCILLNFFTERPDFKKISNYQDQLEPSVDARELQSVETPPAKLTLQGSPQQFRSSLVLSELQKEMNQKEDDSEQPIQEDDEEKKIK
ncbi:unnamed protein product (macronuclear) [Paramecium tetraurelia]|uniref:Derlin n=1 Tax=Paramecium tetraurelia TaxID=5888 RepID=A0DAQ3_PARTE|nr:uncharacterized protein GSPATT00015027001 [Paramecium tetraurelia]CAK80120.1 unnamed protein product [Paramecium tetraurelia]|eukprot:XP_001447517.1 hypothetical protein (macronuclear) [Paramecium tetraurelia strain d4-2]